MKKIKLILITCFFLLTTIVIAHAFVFPQQTRCILVDFYDFEKEDNLYFRKNSDPETIAELKNLIQQAEIRVADFWKNKTTNPKFIYCESDDDYLKFGVPFLTPACANMKLGSYVVISKNGIDLDILAHEISHTELFERIGFWNREFKIPTWFDEGLAMQVDYRNYYSIDTLQKQSDNFKNLPDVMQMNSFIEFGNGTHEEIKLNYSTAKYEISKWYTPQKLNSFIEKINNGKDFSEAFNN